MALSQFDIIKSLGESIAWFEKELSWGMPIAELRHLTGRIGELYVAMMTLGQLADSVNQKGYDVVSSTGQRISVKTVTKARHVDFNIKTLDLVDRAIVLRIDPSDLCINVVYDMDMVEFKAKSREYRGKYTLGVASKSTLVNSYVDIGLNEPLKKEIETYKGKNHIPLIINNIIYDGYEIKQYENAKIEIYKEGLKQQSAKEVLKKIALPLNVSLDNSAGNPKNTQQLGDHVIKAIKNLRSN
ncbi:hypothetical protein GCM10027155_19350 [Acinetobacter apis]|uniref:DUF6998 domain-containing protein n=1 Tax=Acinetobacter apis TaxID=1229165 RepID=A0A217EIK9_9GAMM|nr:hypothetical protein [Acinetobacter apis]SNQ30244.1 hypothetical protein SAMN05444584_2232 [Acinetobacter apis]